MEKEKLKKVKIGFMVCIVVLVLLVLVIVFMKKERKNPVTNVGTIEIDITEKSVSIENFDAILSKLPMKSVTMHEKVQDFALQYLKKIHGSLAQASSEEIQKYYEANKGQAEKFLYDNRFENFEKFVASISKLKSQKLTYTENGFELDTFRESQEGYSFEMRIKYQDEEDLTYRVHVQKKENATIGEDEIKFEAVL